MLYPKNLSPLTDEDFKNPGNEYRATPFWGWNTRLDKDELIRQIGIFKEMGFGGFHMHVRTGMATDYLSDEYMDLIAACVEKARKEHMLSWLYDEDRWPSGAAGGLITKNKALRIRHLLLTRHSYGTQGLPEKKPSWVGAGRCENGELLACFDIILDGEGSLLAYKKISEHDKPRGFKLYAYVETALPNPWFNNQTYIDTLNPQAIMEFIRVTYDRYAERFLKDFGGLIPAIFTDEPQFAKKETLNYAHEDKDIALPWTADLPQTYSKAYNGEDIISGLPELLWDLPGGDVSVIRYHYHDHIAERFSQAFADQCGDWCSKHNLMLTGHMMEEPTLESQTHALGEAMRSYRSFQLPGIDMLCDRREFTTAKQAQSAARQYGCPGVLSELYGVTNWNFDFRGHKLQGDWQAALGVSVRVPHLSWVSMNGEAKRDYPGTFNYQAAWYREYPYIEDHFARLNTALTRGRAVCRVGVIHPIESYWMHWGPRESTEAVRASMDEKFLLLCDWLLRGLIDFDYISESLLADQCELINVSEQMPVGKMKYDAIIVPAMQTIRSSTLDRLESFRSQGGKLVFLGPAPFCVNAVPDERGQRLWEQSEHLGFDRLEILHSLEELREIRIRDSSGALSKNFIYQLREEDNNSNPVRWLFICQADREYYKDMPLCDDYNIQIRGEWQTILCDTINGVSGKIDSSVSGGWTTVKKRLWDHDSLLLKLVPADKANHTKPEIKPALVLQEPEIEAATRTPRFTVSAVPGMPLNKINYGTKVPVTLHEPNVLVLDIAEFALDDNAYRPGEEILRLDNILRKELGWPLRGNHVAQPWVEHDSSTPHTLRLRYTFESMLVIKGAELALENAAVTKVTLNGEAAGETQGWYVDKCMGRVKLPDIKAGNNILELILPYGKKVDAEACFLLGDFSVNVKGTCCTLGEPVKTLGFGDICHQGLPFYGGNLTYHLELETTGNADSISIAVSSYRFMLLKAAVDGIDRGVIAFSPYRLVIDGLEAGRHKLDLTAYGCRINTFGQLHNNQRHDNYTWWGPNSWRSEGPQWSYEYCFWPQGILKSPEIYLHNK